MPPPRFWLGNKVATKIPVNARICLRKGGYKKVLLPPGTYMITEIWRDEEYWHDPEMSDGYTYRIIARIDGKSERVSIWQNDLLDGIYGEDE